MKTPKKTKKTPASKSLSPSTDSPSDTSRNQQMNFVNQGASAPIPSYYNVGGQNGASSTTLNVPYTGSTFSTGNIYLAAALCALGKDLIDIKLNKSVYPYRGEFIFPNESDMESLVVKFHNYELKVDASTVFFRLRELKKQVQLIS